MLFRNTRVYPIRMFNELGKVIIVQPSETCDVPLEIGNRYDSLLEPVFVNPTIEATHITENIVENNYPTYIDESDDSEEVEKCDNEEQIIQTPIKKGRGRPKKVI